MNDSDEQTIVRQDAPAPLTHKATSPRHPPERFRADIHRAFHDTTVSLSNVLPLPRSTHRSNTMTYRPLPSGETATYAS